MAEPVRPGRLRRVLVPLDGSPAAEAILPLVGRLAQGHDLEIALVRVMPTAPPPVGEGSLHVVDVMAAVRVEAEAYLAAVAEGLTAAGWMVLTAVRVGDAAAEIVAAARECEPDLIAMTTHGRSGLKRLLFGSVAEAVLRNAPVPVLFHRITEEAVGERAA
jgi:nucleotide-binding universal stress UspA family protein